MLSVVQCLDICTLPENVSGEIYRRMENVYETECMYHRLVFWWCSDFCKGRSSTKKFPSQLRRLFTHCIHYLVDRWYHLFQPPRHMVACKMCKAHNVCHVDQYSNEVAIFVKDEAVWKTLPNQPRKILPKVWIKDYWHTCFNLHGRSLHAKCVRHRKYVMEISISME